MAFSKELEEVIEATLADGVITEKERAVLHKKALLEGVDPDEVMVVIEGRLAKQQKANPATEKRGNIVKCPNCGAAVLGGSAICPECGYEFRNVQANSTAKRFAEQLSELKKNNDPTKLSSQKLTESFIENFPVPNTTEDLAEMLAMLKPNAKWSLYSLDNRATRKLYGKCIDMVRSIGLEKDARFLHYIKYYNKTAKTKFIKIMGVVILFVTVFFGLAIYDGISSHIDDKAKEAATIEIMKQSETLIEEINKLELPTKDNYQSQRAAFLRINFKFEGKYKEEEDIAYKQFFDAKRTYARLLNAIYSETHKGENDPTLEEFLSNK